MCEQEATTTLEEENNTTESLKEEKKNGQRKIYLANIWSISYLHWSCKHECGAQELRSEGVYSGLGRLVNKCSTVF